MRRPHASEAGDAMTATAAVIAAASGTETCGARRSNVSDEACAERELALSEAQLARLVVESLIGEAELTPRPALVEGRGSGAHRDLNLPTMRRSARALEACFEALARASRQRTP